MNGMLVSYSCSFKSLLHVFSLGTFSLTASLLVIVQ